VLLALLEPKDPVAPVWLGRSWIAPAIALIFVALWGPGPSGAGLSNPRHVARLYIQIGSGEAQASHVQAHADLLKMVR
jgi:hypothetical protein